MAFVAAKTSGWHLRNTAGAGHRLIPFFAANYVRIHY
jgi:hypothetical protein